MSIKYSIYQNPPRRDGQKPARHVQVKNLTPTNLYEIAERMQRLNSIYSEGTTVGVMTELKRVMAELLADGHAIHLDGIGTFTPKVSVTISERSNGRGGKRLHTSNLRVSGIDFQPDSELLTQTNRHADFEWVAGARQQPPSPAELQDFLTRHFASNDTLTRADLMQGLQISKDRARTYLNTWVANGTLLREGIHATTCYRKGQ